MRPFSVSLFPNGACELFPHPLSSDLLSDRLVARPAWMSSWQARKMTKGLASPHRHQACPGGLLPSARLVEIGEFADAMNFQTRCGLADLAAPGEEPMNQLFAFGAGHDRPLVGEHGRALV